MVHVSVYNIHDVIFQISISFVILITICINFAAEVITLYLSVFKRTIIALYSQQVKNHLRNS